MQDEESPPVATPGPSASEGILGYDIVKPIGKGKFAIVFKATRLSDGTVVALKKVQVGEMDEKARNKALKEVRLVQSLNHPNIVQYLDSFIEGNELVIALEWAAAGDLKRQLRKAIEKKQHLEERVCWKYFSQIADALRHMHARRIMHRDLKPANIFLTLNGTVKVGDLGLGRELSDNTLEAHSKVGTPLYMSPEVLKGGGYDFSSDVWSAGCLLYELAMLKSPFKSEGLNLYSLFQKISKAEHPPLPPHYSPELKDLAYACLIAHDPKARPTMEVVCEVATRMRKESSEAAHAAMALNGGQPPPPVAIVQQQQPAEAAAAAAAAAQPPSLAVTQVPLAEGEEPEEPASQHQQLRERRREQDPQHHHPQQEKQQRKDQQDGLVAEEEQRVGADVSTKDRREQQQQQQQPSVLPSTSSVVCVPQLTLGVLDPLSKLTSPPDTTEEMAREEKKNGDYKHTNDDGGVDGHRSSARGTQRVVPRASSATGEEAQGAVKNDTVTIDGEAVAGMEVLWHKLDVAGYTDFRRGLDRRNQVPAHRRISGACGGGGSPLEPANHQINQDFGFGELFSPRGPKLLPRLLSTHFAMAAEKLPNESVASARAQFLDMIHTAHWLLDTLGLAQRFFDYGGDAASWAPPPSLCRALLLAAGAAGLPSHIAHAITPAQLAKAYGTTVIEVLSYLTDQVLLKHPPDNLWSPPSYPAPSEENPDDGDGVGGRIERGDGVGESAAVSSDEDSDGEVEEEGHAMMTYMEGMTEDQALENNGSNSVQRNGVREAMVGEGDAEVHGMIWSGVDIVAWGLEVERVGPKLKQQSRNRNNSGNYNGDRITGSSSSSWSGRLDGLYKHSLEYVELGLSRPQLPLSTSSSTASAAVPTEVTSRVDAGSSLAGVLRLSQVLATACEKIRTQESSLHLEPTPPPRSSLSPTLSPTAARKMVAGADRSLRNHDTSSTNKLHSHVGSHTDLASPSLTPLSSLANMHHSLRLEEASLGGTLAELQTALALKLSEYDQLQVEAEEVSAKVEAKGIASTDMGPLMAIKNAGPKLRADCVNMDFRTGVVVAQLLRFQQNKIVMPTTAAVNSRRISNQWSDHGSDDSDDGSCGSRTGRVRNSVPTNGRNRTNHIQSPAANSDTTSTNLDRNFGDNDGKAGTETESTQLSGRRGAGRPAHGNASLEVYKFPIRDNDHGVESLEVDRNSNALNEIGGGGGGNADSFGSNHKNNGGNVIMGSDRKRHEDINNDNSLGLDRKRVGSHGDVDNVVSFPFPRLESHEDGDDDVSLGLDRKRVGSHEDDDDVSLGLERQRVGSHEADDDDDVSLGLDRKRVGSHEDDDDVSLGLDRKRVGSHEDDDDVSLGLDRKRVGSHEVDDDVSLGLDRRRSNNSSSSSGPNSPKDPDNASLDQDRKRVGSHKDDDDDASLGLDRRRSNRNTDRFKSSPPPLSSETWVPTPTARPK